MKLLNMSSHILVEIPLSFVSMFILKQETRVPTDMGNLKISDNSKIVIFRPGHVQLEHISMDSNCFL